MGDIENETKKLSKVDRRRIRKLISTQQNHQQRHEKALKELETSLKKNEKEFKEGKERIRKMRITNMWVGWIMGFVTIVLVTTIVIREFMSVTPNMLVIVIDIFAFFMSINLIYQSFKTRHELRKQIQEELLEELEKD